METTSPYRSKAACALPIGVLVCSLAGTSPVHAQATDDPGIKEIIVVGSRRQANSAITSPVPVDNLRGDLLRNIGTSDMDDVLRTLIPAYNVKRLPLNDESSLVRPAMLRGLRPDNTLILINGKRLHRSAVLAGAFGGAQGPDTSVIPPSSIERVEVLRDGASAQYGSDAIAGVINFVTRDQPGRFSGDFALFQIRQRPQKGRCQANRQIAYRLFRTHGLHMTVFGVHPRSATS